MVVAKAGWSFLGQMCSWQVGDGSICLVAGYSSGNNSFDTTDLLVTYDNGATWHDYAQSENGFVGLYAIGGCPQLTADGYVIGSFTERGRRVHFLRIPVRTASPR